MPLPAKSQTAITISDCNFSLQMQPGIVMQHLCRAPPQATANITRLYHQPRSDAAAALSRRAFALIVEEIY